MSNLECCAHFIPTQMTITRPAFFAGPNAYGGNKRPQLHCFRVRRKSKQAAEAVSDREGRKRNVQPENEGCSVGKIFLAGMNYVSRSLEAPTSKSTRTGSVAGIDFTRATIFRRRRDLFSQARQLIFDPLEQQAILFECLCHQILNVACIVAIGA